MRTLTLLFLFATQAVAQYRQPCNITLRVVDNGGRPAPYRVTSFRYTENQKEYDYAFNGLRGRVQCELLAYTYRLTRTDTSSLPATIDGKTWVDVFDSYLTIVTDPRLRVEPDRPNFGWGGLILPAPRQHYWVHIQSAIGPHRVEAEADDQGIFRVYQGFFEGPYLLHVMDDDGRVIYATSLKMASRSPRRKILIQLSLPPPREIVVE